MVIRSKIDWCLDCEDYDLRVDDQLVNCIQCKGVRTHDIGWIEEMQSMPGDI